MTDMEICEMDVEKLASPEKIRQLERRFVAPLPVQPTKRVGCLTDPRKRIVTETIQAIAIKRDKQLD